VIVRCIDITLGTDHNGEYTFYEMEDIIILEEGNEWGYLDKWDYDPRPGTYLVTEVTKEQNPEYFL
jgi:hypothetical protein